MKILLNLLHLTSERLGGSWTYSINLVHGLEAFTDEHEIIVLANKKIAGLLGQTETRLFTVEIESENRIKRIAWENIKLPGIVKSIKPDIFHGPANTLPENLPCPGVVTIHDFQYKYYPENFPFLRRQYLTWSIPRSLRRAEHVIAVSNFTKKDAVRFVHIPDNKISIIYEAGLNAHESESSYGDEEILIKNKISTPFLLSVGSSLPHKNLLRLIKAFARVANEIPQNLILVGEEFGYGSALQTMIDQELGSNQTRLHHIGFVDRKDLITLYRKADAFIFPSLFEGFGIPLLEALQSGCPIAVSNSTSLPEIGGEAAIYFDPLNVDEMALSIRNIALDSTCRSKLQKLGYKQALKFSWDTMASETLDIYKKAIGT
ncbi:MAG: glycosyltransferase family 1 protein [Bacteroidota bacterium]